MPARKWFDPSRILDWLVGQRRGRRVIVLLLGLLVIVGWQAKITAPKPGPEGPYHMWAATGVHGEPHFFFFQYHLGLYPLATDAPILDDTKAEAQRLLQAAPKELKQDEGVTFRSGDRGRVYLYYVDAWRTHRSTFPSVRPAHQLAFTVALLSLWTAFWWIAQPGLGALLVLFLGSNPFQLYSIHAEENVFSWAITAMIVLLALHAPLMVRTRSDRFDRWYPWIAAVATAVFMTLVRTVRSEPMPLLLGPVLVYATLSRTRWWKKLALVAVLSIVFSAGNYGAVKFFESKFRKAERAIINVGGEPYEGPVRVYHEFWHVLYCGLGDFDTKYGYEWNDLKGYSHAYERLQAQNPGLKLNPNSAPQDFYYDKAKKYPVFYSEVAGYHDIIREKVVGDIKKDPWWYFGIIRKRVWRVLTETTPVSIAYGDDESFQTKSPLFGLAAIPLLAFFLVKRKDFHAKLLVFSTPLAVPAIAAYSDRGMAFYSCLHIFVVAILCVMFFDGLRVWRTRRHDF